MKKTINVVICLLLIAVGIALALNYKLTLMLGGNLGIALSGLGFVLAVLAFFMIILIIKESLVVKKPLKI